MLRPKEPVHFVWPGTRFRPVLHGLPPESIGSMLNGPVPARCPSARGASRRHALRGYTLVELLITIAIIAVLLSLLLPAVGRTMSAARGFRCQQTQRSVAFDFRVFADRHLHGDRGDDRDLESRGQFRLETFGDSQYGLDEFWAWGTLNQVTLPDNSGRDPMRCAEVKGPVTLLRSTPCTAGAINPPQQVSFSLNYRLHWNVRGQVRLDSTIVEAGRVPLLWDTNASLAVARGVLPVFSAPGLGSTGPLADDRLWFPALRHTGAMNVAFADGSVGTSARPLDESQWKWSFEPR